MESCDCGDDNCAWDMQDEEDCDCGMQNNGPIGSGSVVAQTVGQAITVIPAV